MVLPITESCISTSLLCRGLADGQWATTANNSDGL